MLNADFLLERLNKITCNMPNYYLSNTDTSFAYRSLNSTNNYQTLQGNIKKLALKKMKNSLPLQRMQIRSSIGTPRKRHCMELIQGYIHRPTVALPQEISVFSSKAKISRHRTGGYTSRSPHKSPRTRYITVNIPSTGNIKIN